MQILVVLIIAAMAIALASTTTTTPSFSSSLVYTKSRIIGSSSSSSSGVAHVNPHSSLEAHSNERRILSLNSPAFLLHWSCWRSNHPRVRSFDRGWDVSVEEDDGNTWMDGMPTSEEFGSRLLASSTPMDEIPEKRAETKRTRGQKTDFDFQQQKIPDHLLPKVAIVGRPNVGKSALFNRLVGRNVSIVHDEPGVTRDRLYARAFWETHEFIVVDTGGVISIPSSASQGSDALAVTCGGGSVAISHALKDATTAGLPALIEQQAASAVEEALVIIFVVDGQVGVTASDLDIAEWLRKKHSNKSITLAVNKCESPVKGLLQAAEFWCLGFTPIAVSAISGTGTGDLLDDVCRNLTSLEMRDGLENEKELLAIAIVGKPNVGKSSILNALVGEERTIVSPVSGTTRDAIDTKFTGPDGKMYRLIDTAGIRRRAAVASAGSKTESLSVNRALKAIRRSDVVALVIDAMDCVTEQDYKLAEIIEKEGKACIIVVNKWDTIPDKDSKTTVYYEQDVREKLRVVKWAPIVYTSATNNQRIGRILEVASNAGQERCRRLSTAVLNQVIQEAVLLRQPPTTRGGKKGRIYYCTQVNALVMAMYYRKGHPCPPLDWNSAQSVDAATFPSWSNWIMDANSSFSTIHNIVCRGGAERSRTFCRTILKLATDPEDVVFDPFAGTGNMARECMRHNRNCVCVENDEIMVAEFLTKIGE